jgi:hypothetical protein
MVADGPRVSGTSQYFADSTRTRQLTQLAEIEQLVETEQLRGRNAASQARGSVHQALVDRVGRDLWHCMADECRKRPV